MAPTRLLAALMVALLIGLLCACGATEDTPDTTEDADKDDGSSAMSLEDWQLSYADCMRDKGIDVPDPSGGSVTLDNDADTDAFAAATEECRKMLGDPPAAGGDEVSTADDQALAEQLDIAKCLREQGYDVADPKAGAGLSIAGDIPPDVLTTCAPKGIPALANP